jgi:predicted metalloprotease
MKWNQGERSENLEDRRGQTGGGGGPFRLKLGLGGTLILIVLSLLFRKNLFQFVGGPIASVDSPVAAGNAPVQASASEEKLVDFVSFVLDDTQAVWTKIFAASGKRYEPAKLVLFRNGTNSGCGSAQSAIGPFYCPADQKVYIDLGFYDDLHGRFGAPGDFAQAYVLAHELGHHVQNLLGIDEAVSKETARRPDRKNELSVRMELQADCFAGIWAHSAAQRDKLEAGDAEEGIGAASAVGDDRLQKMSTGQVQPESWTHGSSKQRVDWFQRGMQTGDMKSCDTFAARR